MEFLILLGIGLTIGGVAIALDDDDDEVQASSSEPTDGDDRLSGSTGDDLILAGEGDDAVLGNEGDDRLFGAEGVDILLGGEGDDFMRGGDAADLLIDGDGSDTLMGDAGDDVIIASGFLNDEATSDLLANPPAGITESEILELLEIDFSQDTDTAGDEVSGGAGDDIIYFGSDDTVTGGGDGDTFVTGHWIEENGGAVITDFNPDEDQIVYGYDQNEGFPSLTLETREAEDGSMDAVLLHNGNEILTVIGQGNSFSLFQNISFEAI
ncbi:calcium-binding protein [Leisingera sp. ANG-M6]|uniref:calcium-binding protein n=1 Tax=Leisingera sp. ANG-M6 TaxID=1577900 RepID=UPI00057F2F37|nr:hypothetical protein [Leisingera sp. ANG-M6]KIC29707.1 hypothetical protein RA24_06195 [Leisingera sp. ANG-M6]